MNGLGRLGEEVAEGSLRGMEWMLEAMLVPRQGTPVSSEAAEDAIGVDGVGEFSEVHVRKG